MLRKMFAVFVLMGKWWKGKPKKNQVMKQTEGKAHNSLFSIKSDAFISYIACKVIWFILIDLNIIKLMILIFFSISSCFFAPLLKAPL